MRSTVGRTAFYTLTTGLSGAILSIGAGIITARWLGPNDRGVLTLAVTLPHTVVALVKLGLAQASVYSIKRDKVPPSLVASQVLSIALVGSVVALIAMYLFKFEALHVLMKGAPVAAFLYSMFLVPFLLIESYFFAILQGLGRFSTFNRRQLIGNLLNFAGIFVTLVMFHAGLLGVLTLSVILTISFDLWLIVTIHRLCRLRPVWDGMLAKRMLGFGVKSHLQSIATHLHFRADMYFVAALLNPSEVAFYSIATRMAELLLFVPESLGLVIYPRQAGAALDELQDLTARSCRHIFFTTLLAGIVLLFIGPRLLVAWYGQAYAPAGPPMFYLIPAAIMMALFVTLTRNFTSQNRQTVNIIASGVALGCNVLFNALLIPRIGISGAGLASLVSYSLATAILARVYLRDSGKSVRDLLVIRGRDLQPYRRLISDLLGARVRRIIRQVVVLRSAPDA